MKSLESLTQNIEALIQLTHQQDQRIQSLENQLQLRQQDLMQAHADLVNLKQDFNRLHTAHALLSEQLPQEDRTVARQRITNLIAQVDRALTLLTQ